MQQWIPRTQTLEPKVWGQVGLRQGLYIGLGVFAGIFFLIALAPFGIGPRIATALLALAAGAAAGFVKFKGLNPERYIFHRLRFALRRRGTGLRQIPDVLRCPVATCDQAPVNQQEAPQPVLAPPAARPRKVTPTGVTPAARWGESIVQVSPFGLGFYMVAWGAMGTAIIYLSGRVMP